MVWADALVKVWRIMTTLCAAVQVFTAVNQVGRMAASLQSLENEIRRLSDCKDESGEDDIHATKRVGA